MNSHAKLLASGLAFTAVLVACAVATPDNIPLCSSGNAVAGFLSATNFVDSNRANGCLWSSDGGGAIQRKVLGSSGTLQECYGRAEQYAADTNLSVVGDQAYVMFVEEAAGACSLLWNYYWTESSNASTVDGDCPFNSSSRYATCVLDLPDDDDDGNNDAAVTGDPHFVGFNGAKYDYHGVPGATFNLISTEQTQVNALLGLEYVNGLTYITTVGVSTGTTHVKIAVIQGKMRVFVDDVEVYPTGNNTLKIKDVDVTFKEMTAEIESPDIHIALSMHKALFLDLKSVKLMRTVQNIHGVLGQTAAHNADATTTYAGVDSEYYVSGLWAVDFEHNKFTAGKAPVVDDIPRRTAALTKKSVHMPNTAAVVNNAE